MASQRTRTTGIGAEDSFQKNMEDFLNEVFEEHFNFLPEWVDEEKFRIFWTEQFRIDVEETLEKVYNAIKSNKTKQTEIIHHYLNMSYLLRDCLVVPFSSTYFDPHAHGGIDLDEECRYFIPITLIEEYLKSQSDN
jgi:hypothetical protein